MKIRPTFMEVGDLERREKAYLQDAKILISKGLAGKEILDALSYEYSLLMGERLIVVDYLEQEGVKL